MNIRSEFVLELIKDTRVFRAHMPVGATYQECYDVIAEFAKQIITLSEQAAATATKVDQENSAATPSAPEVTD
jgi:hypothetical protein